MRKCAVVIGVDKTGQLPPLNAAASGAQAFHEWAKTNNYDSEILTDEQGPVTVRDIKVKIKRFVDARVYDLMVIYFSGHGVLKSASDEYWLLSEAPTDPNEAVTVQPSRLLARLVGIPHIVFISDACRSIPEDGLISGVCGSVIFPNVPPADSDVDVDMFYAAKPGDPAYEVKQADAIANFRGVYTNCLLRALSGGEPEVLTYVTEGQKDYSMVLAYELKEHLKKAVPIAAETANIRLVQKPDAEVASRSPKYLVRYESKPKTDPSTMVNFETFPGPDKGSETKRVTMSFNREQPATEVDLHTRINSIMLQEAESSRSDTLETGFTITGLLQQPKFIGLKDHTVFFENGAFQVAVNDKTEAGHCLLILPDGSSVPLVFIKGFAATVVFEKDALVNINYTPTLGSPKFADAAKFDREIAERRASIAVMNRNGGFTAPKFADDLIASASYLRIYKSFDPTLALYAAYAYAEMGDFSSVGSIYKYMRKEPFPVLFDVAMLREFTSKDHDPETLEAAFPLCPMLNKGWSYLTIDPKRYRPGLLELAKYRIPGLWTTLTSKGTELYLDLTHLSK